MVLKVEEFKRIPSLELLEILLIFTICEIIPRKLMPIKFEMTMLSNIYDLSQFTLQFFI